MSENTNSCSPGTAPSQLGSKNEQESNYTLELASPHDDQESGGEQARRGRRRRTFKELVRDFACDVTGCNRVYASFHALKQHKRIKHSAVYQAEEGGLIVSVGQLGGSQQNRPRALSLPTLPQTAPLLAPAPSNPLGQNYENWIGGGPRRNSWSAHRQETGPYPASIGGVEFDDPSLNMNNMSTDFESSLVEQVHLEMQMQWRRQSEGSVISEVDMSELLNQESLILQQTLLADDFGYSMHQGYSVPCDPSTIWQQETNIVVTSESVEELLNVFRQEGLLGDVAHAEPMKFQPREPFAHSVLSSV
eukprot:comp18714_c0_seq1/m.20458 comp18714_c0_seq1/g.20458  ORF comp18714_c0_seq1/g.20458 comp18714_c0_seq1/m.20458 type:complete len:305 (-) comp18714_c0_seq1:340-1254(-)